MRNRIFTLSLLALASSSLACATTYTGREVAADTGRIDREPGWIKVDEVPWIQQRADWDCGVAALSMVLRYWSIDRDAAVFEEVVGAAMRDERAIRAGDLRAIARNHGADAFLFHGTMKDLEDHLAKGRPVLVGEHKPTSTGVASHYAVVVGLHPGTRRVMLLDPANGVVETTYEGFDEEWSPTGRLTLLVLAREKLAAR